jgi:signal peptidase
MTQPAEVMTHHLSGSEVLPELVKEVLSKGVECRFQAKGHSMSPFIKDGDIVTISPLTSSSPGLGDVVALNHPENEKLIIHRVVKKRNNDYYVKGDNALEADGLVQAKNILGYVNKVERDGKNVRLGLGPERFLIAFLTRKGLLFPLVSPLWRIIRPFIKLTS